MKTAYLPVFGSGNADKRGGVRMPVDRTLRRHAKTLVEDGYADKLGKGNQTRYTVTEQGRHLIGAGVRTVRTQ